MKPSQIWSGETKFIEFDACEGSIGSFLLKQGFSRFLTVCKSKKRVASMSREYPELSGRVICSSGPKLVRRNNADALILSGKACWQLWRFRNLRHAQHVAWCPKLGIIAVFAALGCLLSLLLRRFCWTGIVPCRTSTGRTRYLVIFRVRRRKGHDGARCYVPHALGMSSFLERLTQQQIRYVVLRWFESLPALPPGEDLDLLVDDDCVAGVRAILNEGPGIQPCDLYSVTGLPGSDFRKMPYFPPYLAEAILDDARPYRALCLVPSPEHHFLSLAHHALYHKGARSGLPSNEGKMVSKGRPEHDYAQILHAMAGKLGMDVRVTLEDLDAYLDAQGWRPPRDMLARLAGHNRWLHGMVGRTDKDPGDPGLVVFVVRQEAFQRGGLEILLPMLEHHGFDIIRVKRLTAREAKFSSRCIRGGNWGRGPWKISGGPPAAVVVAYDTEPIPPSAWQKRQFPHLMNARQLMKKKIREAFNKACPQREPCNILHSSDNGREAWEYIHVLVPEAAAEIQLRIREIRQAYGTPQRVLETFTKNGRRAKVELIDFGGRPAVKKTFKACQRRYCLREADAMRQLSRTIAEVPPLLAADAHSVVYPYYDDVLRYKRSSGKLLPLHVAKQAINALRNIHKAGFTLIDAHAENIIVDRAGGLKLIDFEFLYRYGRKPSSFEQSYDIVGPPADFDGDLPDGGAANYKKSWQPYVGLSLHSLLNDPAWLQYGKRLGYYVAHAPRLLPKRVRYYYRSVRATLTAIIRPRRATRVRPSPMPSFEPAAADAVASPQGMRDVRLFDPASQAAGPPSWEHRGPRAA